MWVNIYEIPNNVMNGSMKDDQYTKMIAQLTIYLPGNPDTIYLKRVG